MTQRIAPSQRLLFLELQIGIIRRMSKKLKDVELSELNEIVSELSDELRDTLKERTFEA